MDGAHQLVDLERLGNVRVHAVVEKSIDFLRHGIGTQRNDGCARRFAGLCLHLANSRGRGNPVHHRHVDVQDQRVITA